VFIQPRRRRGSREPEYRSPALRRERMIAHYVTGVVRMALAVALAVAAGETYNLLRVYGTNVSPALRLALPLMFLLAAATALRMGIQSVRSARQESSAPTENDPSPDDPGS
jgi:hypothetical protein